MTPPKVCIIFPNLNPTTPTHYWYWQQLFEKIQKDKLLELKLIDETTTSLFLRPLIILKSRLFGYKNYYIHYSFSALIISWLITRILGGTTYYWHCEKFHQFHIPLMLTPQGIWKKIWQDYIFRLCLKLTDFLVTGHPDVAKSYTQVFQIPKEKIRIVPNYVTSISAPKKKLSKDKTHILFVHHLSPRKGSHELPEIIKLTLEKIPQAHFHIIGSGPNKHWLHHQLSKTNLAPEALAMGGNLQPTTYNLYGSLPLKHVVSYLKAVDYLILPSRAEGFPRVILEAMLYKIPFVATNVGCIKQIVSPPQHQFLIPPKNPQQFATKLISLINLPPKQKQALVKSNHHQALKYNQSRTLKSFLRLF
jgi:glycosyltransferase involved in cell wall biosynthesis